MPQIASQDPSMALALFFKVFCVICATRIVAMITQRVAVAKIATTPIFFVRAIRKSHVRRIGRAMTTKVSDC